MVREYILGIDYGTKRVGLALAHNIAQLPRPLLTLPVDDTLLRRIKQMIDKEAVKLVVVGLPRNMDGSLGFQAEAAQTFVNELASLIEQPVELVEETLSSIEASEFVDKATIARVGLDAVAAAIILARYFSETKGNA